jgi:hypothetical protein
MKLVDTNVLLDVATDDPKWARWSLRQLDVAAKRGPVCDQRHGVCGVLDRLKRARAVNSTSDRPWRSAPRQGCVGFRFRRSAERLAAGNNKTKPIDRQLGAKISLGPTVGLC